MRLQRAGPADADTLAAAHALGFATPWSGADFAELLAGPGVFGLMARDEAAVRGLGLFRTVLGEMEVLTLAVDPAARRQGVGRALMTAALAIARGEGAEACFLEVAADNPGAEALYAGLGFRAAGRRRGYYDRGAGARADAVVMRLDLTSNAP